MDLFDEELLSLWHALDNNRVQYLMVGGFAINLHGYQRFTGDVDLWIKDNRENRQRIIDALKSMGHKNYDALLTTQLIPGWTSIKLNAGVELDLMTYIHGLEQSDFDACYQMASIFKIDQIQIPFLHINDLIRSKEKSDRLKDQADAEELKKIRDQSK